MYVTRPLSMYRNSPTTLSAEPPPQEGPYSGILVTTDEEAEAEDTCCWGACKLRRVKRLPFPQDQILTVVHSSDIEETSVTKVWFIPVLDQPLSSNRYYVIRAKGKYKGRACKSSRETEMGMCCFRNVIRDMKPKPFDHRNIYQQFKIHRHHRHTFFATSAATDGLPPKFLRKRDWELRSSSSSSRFHPPYKLSEALGLDNSLRTQLPSFDFPITNKRSSVSIVGKWYCPFVFVREEARLRRQMRKSVLYKMTLERWWENIASCVNNGGEGDDDDNNVVHVDASVQREMSYVYKKRAVRDDKVSHSGFVWFRIYDRNNGSRSARSRRCNNGGGGGGVGLSLAIVEKMKWVQEEGGWVGGREKEVRVERVEDITSQNGWQRFGCFVLVESFVLRRMDGSLVLRCDFRHTHKVKSKWV